MKENQTTEERYQAWVNAVNYLNTQGWVCIHRWIFKSPSGSSHDLSCADLTKLDSIVTNNHFTVN